MLNNRHSHYHSEVIENLRNSQANTNNSKKEHDLYLLGTDVKYVAEPGYGQKYDPASDLPPPPFKDGETFSFLAQFVSHMRGEESSKREREEHAKNGSHPHYAHPYSSDSVDVVNGADIKGDEAGQRIAKGLMIALGAIAKGRTNLNISGFSRGAVECIVVTNELKRIRNALREERDNPGKLHRSLATIIADSSSVRGTSLYKLFGMSQSYTKAALEKLVDTKTIETDDEQLKVNLLNNLEALNVNLFTLDPVPGDDVTKYLPIIGWQDQDYFYSLPDFVKKSKVFVEQHETSNCFIPIVPEGMDYEIIPGCHGSADGNKFDDNNRKLPSHLPQDLSGAQNLAILTWLNMIYPPERMEKMSEEMSKEGLESLVEKLNLKHESLEGLTKKFLLSNKSERRQQLLSVYDNIRENLAGYEELAKRNYDFLGQVAEKRPVYFKGEKQVEVDELDKHRTKHFINKQHILLWIEEKTEISDFPNKSIKEQIEWLEKNITNAFIGQDINLSGIDQAHMINKLINNNSNNYPIASEALTGLIVPVIQRYLNNHLPNEERESCVIYIKKIFEKLDLASQSKELDKQLSEFAIELKAKIKRHLTDASLQYQSSLLSFNYKLFTELKSATAQKAERNLQTLVNIEKTWSNLNSLSNHVEDLQAWCNIDELKAEWEKILNCVNHNKTMEELTSDIKFYIVQQRKVLLNNARELCMAMDISMNQKPVELKSEKFYTEIFNPYIEDYKLEEKHNIIYSKKNKKHFNSNCSTNTTATTSTTSTTTTMTTTTTTNCFVPIAPEEMDYEIIFGDHGPMDSNKLNNDNNRKISSHLPQDSSSTQNLVIMEDKAPIKEKPSSKYDDTKKELNGYIKEISSKISKQSYDKDNYALKNKITACEDILFAHKNLDSLKKNNQQAFSENVKKAIDAIKNINRYINERAKETDTKAFGFSADDFQERRDRWFDILNSLKEVKGIQGFDNVVEKISKAIDLYDTYFKFSTRYADSLKILRDSIINQKEVFLNGHVKDYITDSCLAYDSLSEYGKYFSIIANPTKLPSEKQVSEAYKARVKYRKAILGKDEFITNMDELKETEKQNFTYSRISKNLL